MTPKRALRLSEELKEYICENYDIEKNKHGYVLINKNTNKAAVFLDGKMNMLQTFAYSYLTTIKQ